MSAVNTAARPAEPSDAALGGATRPRWRAVVVALVAGGGTALVALDGGAYSVQTREAVAVALWWAVAVGVAAGLLPRTRLDRTALVAGGLLAAVAAWTLLSALWAPAPETAYVEANRVSLYLGLFAFVVLAARAGDGEHAVDGLGLGIGAVAVLALASRLFPGFADEGALSAALPGTRTRLSWPVDYWNGLGILVALGVPLLLRTAVAAERGHWRIIALAPVPVVASVIFLTSSRGAAAVAVLGVCVLLVLTDRRIATLAALAIGAAGSALAIVVIRSRDVLVDGPFDGSAATQQGRSAALLVALICLGTVAAYAPVAWFAPVRAHVSSTVRAVVVALVAVAAIAGLVAADPGERLDRFKVPPSQEPYNSKDYVESHLLSGGGSGRWQFWGGATDEWAKHRFKGGGAGTFEAWWAANGSIQYFVRDAHSLWLETLGELGLVGLLLIAGFVLVVLWRGGVLSLRGPPDGRSVAAAATAVVAAWALGAAIDWMWELTAVTLVAIACAALLTGPAVRPSAAAEDAPRRLPRGAAIGLRMGLAALAIVFIVGHALPLLGERRLEASQEAARAGDTRKAEEAARDARRLEPWASAPPAQLALLAEASGDLPTARRWIDEALSENSDDWRLWLTAARIETKAGDARQAQRSLRRARELNPRSPLFASSSGSG